MKKFRPDAARKIFFVIAVPAVSLPFAAKQKNAFQNNIFAAVYCHESFNV